MEVNKKSSVPNKLTNTVLSKGDTLLTCHAERDLLVDKSNTEFAETTKRKVKKSKEHLNEISQKEKILLPVKKRKLENPKRHRTKSSDVSQQQCKLDFPPCKVCLGKGSGLHYGVNSCESCKSFFRRCLTRKAEYMCSKSGNCPVTSQNRGNCSGCRYQRCLKVGMSREAACLGRYTLSRRTQTIMEAKGKNNCSVKDQKTRPYAVTSSNHGVAELDIHKLLRSDIDLSLAESLSSILSGRSHSRLNSIYTDSLQCPGIQVALDSNSAVTVMYIEDDYSGNLLEDIELINKLVDFMDQIHPFGNIVTEEQIKSKLQEDYESYVTKAQVFGKMKPVPQDEYFALLESTGIDIDGRQEFLRQSAMSCQPVLHSYIAFANVVTGFSSLSLEDQCSLLKTSHFEVFLLLTYKGYDPDRQMILTETGKAYHIDQAADIFYSRNLINSIFAVCKKIQNLKLTKEETALLLAIAVTFGDRCLLEDSSKVDEIQLQVVHVFRSFLARTRPGESSLFFTKVVDCFVAMRAVNDQYLKEYSVICQDKLVQKEAPIWLAYINSKTVHGMARTVKSEEQPRNECSD